MQQIFSKQVARNDLEVYLDDVLAYSKDHNEMLRTLDEAMKNLIDSGMKINIEGEQKKSRQTVLSLEAIS